MDNWLTVKNQINKDIKHNIRRIDFHPAKSTSIKQVIKTNSVLNMSKNTNNSNNNNNNSNNDGLFDPKIVVQYLAWNKISRVGPGFFNDGNSCYLNSTLQCLMHTPSFVQIMKFEQLNA
jgi:ubiquitin carboxyl-terminal hydrolase 36/42